MAHLLRKPQQGAAAVIVALWMGVALSCLMVLDIGNLIWQKREIQKIADLAAVAGIIGSLQEGEGSCKKNGEANAKLNGFLRKDSIYSEVGYFHTGVWGKSGAENLFQFSEKIDHKDPENNACRVTITRSVPYFFIFQSDSKNREISAVAVALQTSSDIIKFGISSELAEVDTSKSAILDPIVGGLLGGDLKLSLVGSDGLAGVNLNLLKYLDALALSLDIDAGDYTKILDADVSLGDLLGVGLNVLEKERGIADAKVSVFKEFINTGLKIPESKIKLSNILGLGLGVDSAALDTNVDLFKLISATLQAANAKNGIAAEISTEKLPVIGDLLPVTIGLKVIEPPRWVIGSSKSKDLVAKTSQVTLNANIGLLIASIKLDVGVASGEVRLIEAGCASTRKYIKVEVTPSLINIAINIVPILGKEISIPLDLGEKKNTFFTIENPPRLDEDPHIIKVTTDTLLDGLLGKITTAIGSNLGILGSALIFLGDLLDKLTSPIFSLLDNIVFGLLNLLGIGIGNANAEVQMNCGYSGALVY